MIIVVNPRARSYMVVGDTYMVACTYMHTVAHVCTHLSTLIAIECPLHSTCTTLQLQNLSNSRYLVY